MDKQYILAEIKRTANENDGKPLGWAKFSEKTGILKTDWFGKYWARWGDAVIEAGHQPNVFTPAYDENYILEKLISLIRELDKFPVKGEIILKRSREKDFPSYSAITRVGKKSELIRKIIQYCSGNEGYDDILEICEPITASKQIEPKTSTQDISISGYVYLMKSGRNYKIGKSNAPGRREYELSIQLPEETNIIHEIATDDPIGIEAYWHNRFKDKRKRGEWFDLSSEDIRAFKRRKFM